MNSEPRIPPGAGSEIGRVNEVIARVIGRATGTGPPNLFTTLARHRRLFRPWLRFAARLMPRGSLPRADSELLILRVAHNCGCDYERRHHERIAQSVGLSAEDVARTAKPELAPDRWSSRQLALLRAADELHERRAISDELWARLRPQLSDVELIELCMLVGHYEMLAMTVGSLRVQPDEVRRAPIDGFARKGGRRARASERGEGVGELAGRRVLITGAARGIGAATAMRLHARGARVVLAGIEPELLAQVGAECGGALTVVCDVRDREQVESAVETAVGHLGGLDVVVANAGVAAQLPLVGGDPTVFERTLAVNLLGVYYTLRSAGPHIAHERGYALAVASLAAAVHPPLLGAYSASKAGVEALGNALRVELASSGARVGVAYFAELDTDMTRRGFGTRAAAELNVSERRVTPLEVAIDAIERGIVRRSRRVVAPAWVGPVLPIRMAVQRLVDAATRRGLDKALEVARAEHAPLTTSQPVQTAPVAASPIDQR